jgi:hypothetical protein
LNVRSLDTCLIPDQTNPHPIHSLPGNSITLTSVSWHPSEAVLATTLSSGTLLITRIGEHSDGERLDRSHLHSVPGDLVISNGYGDEYDDEGLEEEGPSFEDSFTKGEEMIVDHS